MTKSKTAGLDQNLLLLAKQGDPEAQLQIAACYAEGNGVEQNDRKAFLWFDKAARQGHAIAQYALGLCYEEGRGVNQYYRGAGRWYKHSAKQGFVYAQLKMGDWYTLGLPPVLKNESTALSWYKKAAKQGNAYAQFVLFERYGDPNSSHYNEKESSKWLELSANNGHADAQTALFRRYGNRHSPHYNEKEYFKWVELLASKGHVVALKERADCYLYEDRNDDKAIELYKKAAEKGHTLSQVQLGLCYYNGLGEKFTREQRKENLAKAVQCFIEAAEKENEAAMWLLGHCYYKGRGVEKNLAKALEWFEKAHNLTYPTINGHNVDYKDLDADFVEKLKEQADDYVDAAYMVGVWYYFNYGFDEARPWFVLASNNNDMISPCILGHYYVVKGEEDAVHWFFKVADRLFGMSILYDVSSWSLLREGIWGEEYLKK